MLANIDAQGFGAGDFDTDPAILKFDPFTADYGIDFYGYARNAGTSVVHHRNSAGWASGGTCSRSRTARCRSSPATASASASSSPPGLWLTLDAGTVRRVTFRLASRVIRLTFDPVTPDAPAALLRIGQAIAGPLPARFAPVPAHPPVRGAYRIPLGPAETTVTLRPSP